MLIDPGLPDPTVIPFGDNAIMYDDPNLVAQNGGSRISLWDATGKKIKSVPTPTPTPNPDPKDFNGSGYDDLVWENTATGQRVIWLLKNGVYSKVTVFTE